MRTIVLHIVVGMLCVSTNVLVRASDTTIQESGDAVLAQRAQESLERVRGMKAAVSDIAENRIWVLSAARACLCPSDSESALQLALKAELKVSPDYELIDDRWPSIVEKRYMPFVSHAALKGYNDVMWAELEHRFGNGTRQRVEKRAKEIERTLRNKR